MVGHTSLEEDANWLGGGGAFWESHTYSKIELMLVMIILRMSVADCYFRVLLSETWPVQLHDCSVQLKCFCSYLISGKVWNRTTQAEALATLSPEFRFALCASASQQLSFLPTARTFATHLSRCSPASCCVGWCYKFLGRKPFSVICQTCWMW